MKKVWNVNTRSWDMVQEGILLHGTDITTVNDFERIWGEVHDAGDISSKHLKQIYNTMVSKQPLPVFTESAVFHSSICHELIKIYVGYADEYQGRQLQGGGRQSNTLFKSIKHEHRDGLAAIIDGDPSPYDRGSHNTRPAVSSGAHAIREYHLTLPGQDGRATSARLQGSTLVALYYSPSHASATYSYHLVTYMHESPLDKEKYEIPLLRNADKILATGRPN